MHKTLWPHACAALLLAVAAGCSSEDSSTPAAAISADAEPPDASTDAADAAVPGLDAQNDAPSSDASADDGSVSDASADDAAEAGEDASACGQPPVVEPVENFFVDISESSGIREDNFVPNPTVPIPINDHSRLGFADINGDGLDDIVAHSLYPNPRAGVPFEHLVFINQGDGTFRNASDESGLRNVQAGFFAFGDVDNDGDQDVFAGLDITDLPGKTHQLLLNDGAGHFTAAPGSGLEGVAGKTMASNGVFADFDNDGDLDLFVANGHTSYMAVDQLFINDGTGVFSNETNARLTGNRMAPSNGAVACDFDNDNDLDIFVSVYGVSQGGAQNLLFENDGSGNFVDVAVAKGFASLATGNYWLASTEYGTAAEPGKEPGTYVGGNGFGLDCGDVNNDGYLDIFLTNISHPVNSDYSRKWSDPSQLLINQGPGAGWTFRNEFLERGLPFNEGDVDGAAVDFDNDGRLDLAISRERKYEGSYTGADQKAWFGLMRQKPDGTFASMGLVSGINDLNGELFRMKGAQNNVWSDIDLDGDLDLLVGGRDTGGGRPNFLFRNEIGQRNRWLGFRLQGDGTNVNRDAIGARVTIVDETRTYLREVRATRGMYNSMDTRALLFGLGTLGCDYSVQVRWPDGTIVSLEPQALGMNRYVTVRYPDVIVP